MQNPPELGIIGGSGLYSISSLSDIREVDLTTPYGKPSAPLVIGSLEGVPVAFLARHGIGHTLSPSEVNYRANIYAMKQVGVKRLVGISACGSLREDYAPGHIVIPDQVFDRTHLRARSFFGEGLVIHAGVADPFCPTLSEAVAEAAEKAGGTVHRGGTFITIEGPRFSTKAESNCYRQWGMSIIGMTTSPEVFLAREAELCYAVMAHVTDYDVWHTSAEPVTVEMVIRTLLANTALAQTAIADLAHKDISDTTCSCGSALADAIITNRAHINPEIREQTRLLTGKYLD